MKHHKPKVRKVIAHLKSNCKPPGQTAKPKLKKQFPSLLTQVWGQMADLARSVFVQPQKLLL